jgi:hypothetical protein
LNITASIETTLHMASPASELVSSPGTVAAPQRSIFQTDSLALRFTMDQSRIKRGAGVGHRSQLAMKQPTLEELMSDERPPLGRDRRGETGWAATAHGDDPPSRPPSGALIVSANGKIGTMSKIAGLPRSSEARLDVTRRLHPRSPSTTSRR